MKGGLAVLAKFKTYISDDTGTYKERLPTWVAVWRIAARVFCRSRESSNTNDPEVRI